MRSFFILAASLLAGAIFACGSDSSNDGECTTVPTTCDGQAPSYATEVKPIIEQHCFPCHAPGGSAVGPLGRDFSKYDAVSRFKNSMFSNVYQCNMPPKESPRPSAEHRATLVKYLACGAPNN